MLIVSVFELEFNIGKLVERQGRKAVGLRMVHSMIARLLFMHTKIIRQNCNGQADVFFISKKIYEGIRENEN